ncbi:usg protein [Parapedomonas caeni]
MASRATELSDLELRLRGYSLATAEILYWMPDHPDFLQSFTWQTLDLAPRFPRIHRFLDHWVQHIEATLHSVRLAHSSLIQPAELRYVGGEFRVH